MNSDLFCIFTQHSGTATISPLGVSSYLRKICFVGSPTYTADNSISHLSSILAAPGIVQGLAYKLKKALLHRFVVFTFLYVQQGIQNLDQWPVRNTFAIGWTSSL